ncbi:helix-turn-helix domain-containing protein [Nocardia sp. NPDC056100]|uniref:helix-turn-helix domain-containing protein n=1 Tax=Nocardia sp. NPDC056100 TaxID=3345712 RepID=UPI0035D9CACE
MNSTSAKQAREGLGNRLREIRLDARFSARELASRAGWHFTKVSKFENGHRTPTLTDLETWCSLCDASDLLPDLVAATREIEQMYVQLRRLHDSGTARYQRQVLDEEQHAQRHRVFSVSLIPGPAQTADYATAVLTDIAALSGYPTADIADTVAVRMKRAELLRSSRIFHMILCENVIRIGIAPPEIMMAQLEHLLAVMDYPHVRLGILPTAIRQYMPVCEFWITDGAEVEIETYSAILRIEQPSEIAVYAKVFDHYAQRAVYGRRARQLIHRAIAELRQHRSTTYGE